MHTHSEKKITQGYNIILFQSFNHSSVVKISIRSIMVLLKLLCLFITFYSFLALKNNQIETNS